MDEFATPFHVTAGYLGQPGSRTFFLQAQDDHELLTVVCEKGQVDGLGDLLARVLAELEDTPATDWDRDAMELRESVEPAWRVGTIGVGVDTDAGRIVLELSELTGEDDDDLDHEEVRLWLDRDIARRLAAHCKEVVGEGRPTCELCGRPMNTDRAHVCPRTNGYGRLRA